MRTEFDVVVEVDASVRNGNPGTGAYGFVALSEVGVIYEDAGMIPLHPIDSNSAEYYAMLKALQFCRDLGYVRNLELRSDSKSCIEHLRHNYLFNSADLNRHAADVAELVDRFEFVSLAWIPRKFNGHADKLSRVPFHNNRNRAMRQIDRNQIDTIPFSYDYAQDLLSVDETWEENYE